MRFLFLLIPLLMPSMSQAFLWWGNEEESCETIDAVSQSACLPPIRGQSDTLWCAEYTLATLVSFELCRKTGTLREVSAAAMSLAYNQDMEGTDEVRSRGHMIEYSVRASNQRGYCLEREVPSTILAGGQVKGLWKLYDETAQRLKPNGTDGFSCNDGPLGSIRELFPAMDLLDILRAEQQTHLHPAYAFTQKSCKTRIKDQIQQHSCADPRAKPKDRLAALDKHLKERPVFFSGPGMFQDGMPWDGTHAVAVVGRQYNKNKKTCEYLIRDSQAQDGRGGLITLTKKQMLDTLDSILTECYVVEAK